MSPVRAFRALAILLLFVGAASCQSTGKSTQSAPTDQKAGNGY